MYVIERYCTPHNKFIFLTWRKQYFVAHTEIRVFSWNPMGEILINQKELINNKQNKQKKLKVGDV